VVPVEAIRSSSLDNLHSLGRPDLLYTFTKLHLWSLTKYERVVFLDADTLVLQNVDELFDVEEGFAACPDIGWPDCFNSGVFVTRPAADTLNQLMLRARSQGSSFDGGDQGLLNDFFPNWHRLSFVYNVTPSAAYTYLPAYRRYRQHIKIVHFIGQPKPWNYPRYTDGSPVTNGNSGSTAHQEFVQLWWQVFAKHVGQWPSSLGGGATIASGGRDASAAAAARLSHDYAQAPQYNASPAPPPSNPFFKSRYDWDETELGMKKPDVASASASSSTAAGTNGKSKFTQPPSDDVLTARLPLKKQQKTTAPPPYQHPPNHK
jgi:hypothetical protein